jgi:hypothetical protein
MGYARRLLFQGFVDLNAKRDLLTRFGIGVRRFWPLPWFWRSVFALKLAEFSEFIDFCGGRRWHRKT